MTQPKQTRLDNAYNTIRFTTESIEIGIHIVIQKIFSTIQIKQRITSQPNAVIPKRASVIQFPHLRNGMILPILTRFSLGVQLPSVFARRLHSFGRLCVRPNFGTNHSTVTDLARFLGLSTS